jgi:uncharacterized membrane protein (UPF0136 family)
VSLLDSLELTPWKSLMSGVPRQLRPLSSALFAGAGFAALSVVLQLTDQPVKILLGSAAMALLAGVTTYRLEKDKTILPKPVLVLLSIVYLAVYSVWMMREPPAGAPEWIAAVLVLAFFVTPLSIAYGQGIKRR